MITDKQHFFFLVTWFSTQDGKIIQRFSAKTFDEAEKIILALPKWADSEVIIQKTEHWVV